LTVTDEDRERSKFYQADLARGQLATKMTDIVSYLRALDMTLVCRSFDKIGLQRIVQLINKSNQFNLTTRRYTDEDILSVIADKDAFGLQLRLVDCFGDHGIIAIVVGRKSSMDLAIDTWLMSCRVLGRQVEEAALLLIYQHAQAFGAQRIIGEYRPTAKNGMVKEHYRKLGFAKIETEDNGTTRWSLNISEYTAPDLLMRIDNNE
jgi:FkbH-like protein